MQPEEEEAQGGSHQHVQTPEERLQKKMEPGFVHLCPVRRPEVMGTN